MEGWGFLIHICEECSLLECNCKVHKLYLIVQSGEGQLESTIVDGDSKGLEKFLI